MLPEEQSSYHTQVTFNNRAIFTMFRGECKRLNQDNNSVSISSFAEMRHAQDALEATPPP